jgi:hypothetical protein
MKSLSLMAALGLTMSAIDARAQHIAKVTTNSWNNSDLHVEGNFAGCAGKTTPRAFLPIISFRSQKSEPLISSLTW